MNTINSLRKSDLSKMSDERIRENAARMILEGETPRDVAMLFPGWFVTNHEGIIRLWETVNRRSWRGNE